ncbi:MAG TPA: cob(I)yrinic acid a,c-diamide adenosyltransferase [Usitatibacteraceae bacterium]|jgi:cob(I)alamin adenosyltransferase|nr:cob(I)yrinic acid a,c-diamide adenosyltransferase [Usitatibacteraceae bacterium]
MGHRLSRIYTRTGDDGTTGLGDGTRVGKDDPRVEAMGTVDELNSAVGRVLAHEVPASVRDCLERVQHDLFDLGAELCLPGVTKVEETHIERLERELDAFNADLPPLKEFILPGGAMAAADAHVARTVCRRAERTLVSLGKAEGGGDGGRRYLNRLSDLLFVIARVLNRSVGRPDVMWQQGRSK